MFIFVGNLSLDVDENDLRSEFMVFGMVNTIILMNDLGIGSGQGRGCGYVEMPSVNEGESAIHCLQGKYIKGRKLDIIKALPVTRSTIQRQDKGVPVMGFSRSSRKGGNRWSKPAWKTI